MDRHQGGCQDGVEAATRPGPHQEGEAKGKRQAHERLAKAMHWEADCNERSEITRFPLWNTLFVWLNGNFWRALLCAAAANVRGSLPAGSLPRVRHRPLHGVPVTCVLEALP